MNIQKGKGMGITITFSDSSGNNRHSHIGSLFLCKSVLGCKGPGPVPQRKLFIKGKILRPRFPGSYMHPNHDSSIFQSDFLQDPTREKKKKKSSIFGNLRKLWISEVKRFFSAELLRGLNMATYIENLPEEYRVYNFSQTYLTVESIFRAEH